MTNNIQKDLLMMNSGKKLFPFLLLMLFITGCNSNQFLLKKEELVDDSQKQFNTKIETTNNLISEKVEASHLDEVPDRTDEQDENYNKPENISELNLNSAQLPPPLKLQIDDVVKFFVWQHPELTHIATVQPDGTLSLPLVGTLPAANKLPDELSEEVKTLITNKKSDNKKLVFSPKDRIRLHIWNQPDLAYVAEVQLDGYCTFPLIGEIKVAGRTISAIRKEVSRKYRKYLNEPIVSILPEHIEQSVILKPRVSILPVKLQPRRVAVLGEVFIKGPQSINGTLQVMEALAAANPKDTSQLNEVILIRNDGNNSALYKKLKIQDYIDGKVTDQNIYLQAGDVIYVPKTTIAKVGMFVDQFFNATRGVFDWWIALQNAQYVRRQLQSDIDVNNIFIDSLK